MPKRLPIKDARDLARKRGLRQVILMAWDGQRTHVVTYGKTVEDCDQAAMGGNKLKKAMDWPEDLCDAEPSRVRMLKKGSVRSLMEAMKRIGSMRAKWDGEELTVFLGTKDEPWGRSEFLPNSRSHKDLGGLEEALDGLPPFSLELA